MNKAKQTGPGSRAMRWAAAPFGRIGKMLGFRWVFWWTLPIPYHPLLVVLLLLSPVLLLRWSLVGVVGGSGPRIHWLSLLVIGLLLAVPLSIPVIRAVAFLFQLNLVQALCFTGSMALLSAEVVAGETHPLLGVLPALFFGTYLFEVVRSRLQIWRWRRMNAAFKPLQPADRVIELSGGQLWTEAMALLDCGLASVVTCDERDRTGSVSLAGHAAVRLPEGAGAAFAERLPKEMRPAGWCMLDSDKLQLPYWPEPAEMRIAWDPVSQKIDSPFLFTVTAGGAEQQVLVGKASAVLLFPLPILLYAIAFPQGRSEWMIGFLRGRARELWTPPMQAAARGRSHTHDARAWRLFAEPGASDLTVDPAPLLARLEREQETMLVEAERRLADLLAGRINWSGELERFRARPERLVASGQALCAMLAEAKEQRQEQRAQVAARLLALLPPADFEGLQEQLLPLLGSRILALRWELTPELDVRPLPVDCPRFGRFAGFGLLDKAPQLWERLGELDRRAARITAALIEEVGEKPPLVRARDRLRDRGFALPPA